MSRHTRDITVECHERHLRQPNKHQYAHQQGNKK